jgi:hypothetical protein
LIPAAFFTSLSIFKILRLTVLINRISKIHAWRTGGTLTHRGAGFQMSNPSDTAQLLRGCAAFFAANLDKKYTN